MLQTGNGDQQQTGAVSYKKKVLNEFTMGAFGAYITIDRDHLIPLYVIQSTNTLRKWLLSASGDLITTPNPRYKLYEKKCNFVVKSEGKTKKYF